MAEAAVAQQEDEDTNHAGLLSRYIDCAEHFIQKCKKLGDIPGSGKLERKCVAELKYLNSLSRRRGGFEITHLRSSNLGHYAGVLHSADNLPQVTHILQAFSCPGRKDPLHMDVVADHGHIWVKVVARKAQALHLIWAGQGQYGERDIALQARDFVVCSKVHPVNFVDPKVVFVFYNGVTAPIAEHLEKCGVVVLGEIVPVENSIEKKLSQFCMEDSNTDEESFSSSDNEIASSGGDIAEFEDRENLQRSCPCFGSQLYKHQHSVPVVTTESLNLCLFCDMQSLEWQKSTPSKCHSVKLNNDDLTKLKKLQEPNTKIDSDSHMSKDKYAERKVEMIGINASSRLSTRQLTDLRTVNKYKSFSIYNSSSQPTSENDCTTSSSIDPQISKINLQKQITSGQFRTADKTPWKESNLVVLDSDNMSGYLLCPKKQFQIDLPNKSVKNIDCNLDKWNFGSASVSFFIWNELLVNPMLDFCVLENIMTANEINSIDKIGKVNLDITALITLVSAVSHGGCNFRFREKILSEQASEERADPVLPRLHAFLKGKQWYSCYTAIESFNNILDTLGGHQEKERASDLLSKLTAVPDEPSFRASMIPTTGKIKDRSKVIFGTGDSLRAVTVTANSGFVRAAEHQGVTFSVFLHASRALTEQKEFTAEKIISES